MNGIAVTGIEKSEWMIQKKAFSRQKSIVLSGSSYTAEAEEGPQLTNKISVSGLTSWIM